MKHPASGGPEGRDAGVGPAGHRRLAILLHPRKQVPVVRLGDIGAEDVEVHGAHLLVGIGEKAIGVVATTAPRVGVGRTIGIGETT